MTKIEISTERASDIPMIHAVHSEAFETEAEARLVDRLRQSADPFLSLVARFGDVVVGHILFTPVHLADRGKAGLLGLAPMAVLPAFQGQGIGGQLIERGLAAARELGARGVVVLGHAAYYPRFGFRPASEFGLSNEFRAPAENFMALELVPDGLSAASGQVRYHAAFSGSA
ncbi:GNAT family N-acetyltransferase [Wenzhouxiangella sediminis]|uniref:N-acetyltransferase n=1 Tax=Wenzhouxiangella sediminis TaxID=1792836 RepID=A0A3E1K9C0_9GAMM|nr:N-acetyltransferase [Wenzhouxiangella sediminis]RFF30699.1 N-acetyltransferase [Wenzhouxiangella sediminis]